MRLCSVSIDLDEIHHYHAIHGLGPPSGEARHAVYDTGLPRLIELAGTSGVPLTLFAVGSDLSRAPNADRLGELSRAGHEVANHSLDHRYDLTRLDRAAMMDQVEGGAAAIERVTGERPVGFRAPGYTMTDQLFDVVRQSGALYDSSIFPCPLYYLAKVGVLSGQRLFGRRSRSIVGPPRALASPAKPYRTGSRFWQRGPGLLELPIQTIGPLRLPFIGTTLTLLGKRRAGWLTRRLVGAALVNLELHGIDALDQGDSLCALAGLQPDLGVPAAAKLETLGHVFQTLKQHGYEFVRLREAARRVG